MSVQRKSGTQAERDSDLAGAETAIHRAAHRAHERAALVANAATTPPRETSYAGTSPQTPLPDADSSRVDDGNYSFSQAQGYEAIPGPLKLGELPDHARTGIWNLIFDHISQSITSDFLDSLSGGPRIRGAWGEILRAKHCHFEHRPADDWNPQLSRIRKDLRQYIETQPFNRVFDLIQFMLRQRACPRSFTARMRDLFTQHRLAYAIDIGPPPTIVPAATPEEGNTVVSAAETLRRAGVSGSALHLSRASECLGRGDWAGSVRESIHAVESVARQLDPEAARTLGPALASLQRHGVLHPALKDAFSKLYGYTSNEQGGGCPRRSGRSVATPARLWYQSGVEKGGEATDEETVQDRFGRVHAGPPGAGGLAGEGRTTADPAGRAA